MGSRENAVSRTCRIADRQENTRVYMGRHSTVGDPSLALMKTVISRRCNWLMQHARFELGKAEDYNKTQIHPDFVLMTLLASSLPTTYMIKVISSVKLDEDSRAVHFSYRRQ